MFQFPGLSPRAYLIQRGAAGHDPSWVPPFGDPRIKACVPLPVAYRSLPRPSSTSCATASAVRPWYLHLPSKVRTEKQGSCFSRYFELVFKHTFAIVLSVHDANHLYFNANALGLWFRIMVSVTCRHALCNCQGARGGAPRAGCCGRSGDATPREIGLMVFRERGALRSTRLGLLRVSLERR